jgi:hypothetical protein
VARLNTIEDIVPLLAAAPHRIAAHTDGLTSAQLRTQPSPDEWSANDVLAHLRACGDVWGGHIMAMQAEDVPTRRSISPRTWIRRTDYLDLDFATNLLAYTTQRINLVATLKSLPDEAWLRTAIVKVPPRPLERTVRYYADSLVVHERPHLKQIEAIVRALRV